MTTSNGAELMLTAPVSKVGDLGQATAIEQSRAVAEVQAAVYLARQFPRDEREAQRAMENSCRQAYVAERAFYRLPRAGEAVTGPTIHLAKELARCWGHIHYGPGEMRNSGGQSEMLVYAWDVQSGTRAFATFIVPHKRDKRDPKTKQTTPVDLITTQEIYENNANNAARRLREQIFGVLPSWFTERAKELCRETLAQGNGRPIDERRAACIAGFAELGITERQLEDKLELATIRWTGHEVAQLGVIFRAIKNGEISKDVEFPPGNAVITTKDIVGEPEKPAPVAELPKPAKPSTPESVPPSGESVSHDGDGEAENVPAEQQTSQGGYEITEQTDVTGEDLPGPGAPVESEEDNAEPLPSGEGPKARRAQLNAIATLMKDNGAGELKDQLAVLSLMLDQPIPSFNVLSAAEATYVYTQVERKAAAGEFAGTLERARQIAAGS